MPPDVAFVILYITFTDAPVRFEKKWPQFGGQMGHGGLRGSATNKYNCVPWGPWAPSANRSQAGGRLADGSFTSNVKATNLVQRTDTIDLAKNNVIIDEHNVRTRPGEHQPSCCGMLQCYLLFLLLPITTQTVGRTRYVPRGLKTEHRKRYRTLKRSTGLVRP